MRSFAPVEVGRGIRSRAKGKLLALAFIAGVVANACDGSPFNPNCTNGSLSIVVIPRDWPTGAYIGDGTTMVQSDGEYVDSVTLDLPPNFEWESPLWVESAGNRPGNYTVTVRHEGYYDWQQANVRVRKYGCDVKTVTLTANLWPLS
jgi:hypothetical protein